VTALQGGIRAFLTVLQCAYVAGTSMVRAFRVVLVSAWLLRIKAAPAVEVHSPSAPGAVLIATLS